MAFGNTPLQETPLGLAMVDGGMPSWLRDRTLFLAPRVFGHYAVKTGWRLVIVAAVAISAMVATALGVGTAP